MAIIEEDELANVAPEEALSTAAAYASDAYILLSSLLLMIDFGSYLPFFAWN